MIRPHSLHSLRVAVENWQQEDRLEALLSLLRQYPCGIDQLSLFTSIVHTPLPLSEIQKRADLMKERMERIRRAGFLAGINILATIGHHNEDLEHCFSGPYPRMTNLYGEVCQGSFCMSEAYIQDYVLPVYRMLAQARPDHIWIDDDIRYGHMPIGMGCFCQSCIDRFNRENGFAFTRETLREALNAGDVGLRRKWLEKQSASISHLFSAIAKTVREIDPSITLGFMTGERYSEGYDFSGFARALSENGKYPIMWRPGGGAYTDFRFDDIVEKAEEIGRQNAYLPDNVALNHSEIENFPYRMIEKTPKSTAMEVLLHVTAGCTGAAFNILASETGEPVSTIEKHLKAIDQTVPFCRMLSEKISRLPPCGIHSGWVPHSQAAVPAGEYARQYGGMYASYPREMLSLGLPAAWHPKNASAVSLTGCEAAVLSDEDLLSLLSGGLYLDAGALSHLNSRGFARYTGFSVGRDIPADAREEYTPDPLNEGFAGGLRNCRQAFNPGDSFEIVPEKEGCRILGRLLDYHGQELAPCCCGVFENELGGRVCVEGYYPYHALTDLIKSQQIKRLWAWLSKDTLPAFVQSHERVRITCHRGQGTLYVTAFNPTNDVQENLRLAIGSRGQTARMWNLQCVKTQLKGEGEGAYRLFTLPALGPYEMVLLEAED